MKICEQEWTWANVSTGLWKDCVGIIIVLFITRVSWSCLQCGTLTRQSGSQKQNCVTREMNWVFNSSKMMPRACLLKTRHRNVCVLCVIECGPDKKTKNVVVEVTFYGHWLSPWSLVKGLLNCHVYDACQAIHFLKSLAYCTSRNICVCPAPFKRVVFYLALTLSPQPERFLVEKLTIHSPLK